jgi:bifunctional DNA-binding transcriptional regulator/antitoxin component of YhaV-PrlF toxin-antitoxin module
MKTTIDDAGNLVVPRDVWRAAGLEPGVPLDIRVEDGAVVIEPVPMAIRTRRDTSWWPIRAKPHRS